MTDGEDATQAGLAAFGDDGAERPAEEARAVAGDGDGSHAVVDPESERYPDAEGDVDVAVTQVDYTIEGYGNDERPIIHAFGRTGEDGRTLEHVRVHGFRPYFYAPTDSIDEDDLADVDAITGWEETGEDGEPYESIRGEKLTKIFGRTPRDVGEIRDRFDHYEADILFPNRFLIDKDVESGIRVPERRSDDGAIDVPHEEVEPVEANADLRVLTFDIEVDDRRGFPEDGEEPIVCLASHDSYRDEYVAWLYNAPGGEVPPPEDVADHDLLDEDATVEVRAFESEEGMLSAFVDYLQDNTDPDVLTGWNCLPADSRVLMADGTEKAIQDIELGDAVVGDGGQETEVAKVTNKWESETEIHEFDLADGSSLRSSGDHRVMVGDNECVDWKRGKNIEPGDYVLKPRRLPVETTEVPELRKLVPTEKQRFDSEDSIKEFKSELPYGAVTEIADTLDVTAGALYHPDPTIWTPKRCEYASERFEVPIPDGGRVYPQTGVDLDRDISPNELYLAGLVLADGTMSREDGIRFYNTRTELHEQFPGDGTLQPDGKGCYKQNVLDYATMYAFNGLGIPFGNKNADEIDLSTIYEMSEGYIGRFLAGVIDGDGHVRKNGITVATENRSLGEWYVKLFRRLGIYARQRENVVRVPDSHRDAEILRENVLPHMSHSEKVQSLESYEGGKSGQTENIPYALFEADVGSDAKRIGNDKHRRGINLKRHETDSEEWEEYVFVEVEDVSTVGTETTYDIETTADSFIAEGCLVHNCDDFDAPYLIARLEELGLDPDRLSRVNEVWDGGYGGPDIKGRVVFDLLYAYQRTKFTELDSYQLDDVAEMELGVGKERYPGDIGDLWEDDPER
ncbi:MAG: 3'-5' exonuclease, partial [Halobacteriales archaeon]